MALPGLRRLAPQQLHVTLYFIGDRAPANDVRAALTDLHASPVALALQGTGRWAGVLWAGVQQQAALSDLQQRVTQVLGSCGLEPDPATLPPARHARPLPGASASGRTRRLAAKAAQAGLTACARA